MNEKYRSRKFGLTIAAIVLASIFLITSKIDAGTWSTVIIFALGMYKAANVAESKNNV